MTVGWGGIITFTFLYTHRHGKLIILLAVLQTQALLFHHQLLVGWDGVRWGGVGCGRVGSGGVGWGG